MRFTLLRHAKASWGDPEVKDHDRCLVASGIKDAPAVAGRLVALAGDVELIVSSSALRARMTADIFARVLGDVELRTDERLYLASPDDILDVAQSLVGVESVILVGHNPGMAQLAGTLAGQEIHRFPTCSLAAFDFDGDWAGLTPQGVSLLGFDRPG